MQLGDRLMNAARLAAATAALLSALALLLTVLDRDSDIQPFFVGLTLAAGVLTWSVGMPSGASFSGTRRRVAWSIVALWLVVAVWIGGLLVMWQAMCACSYPPPAAEATYLGLTATIYHLTGLFGGLLLAALAAVLAEMSRRARPSEQPHA